MVEELNNRNNIMILAPMDVAFEFYTETQINSMSVARLKKFILGHVVEEKMYSWDIKKEIQDSKTLALTDQSITPKKITFKYDQYNNVKINDDTKGYILMSDILTRNGLIHFVTGLLIDL
jgi:uncharacterized surface protein with fasciclin (FAS1) repeats